MNFPVGETGRLETMALEQKYQVLFQKECLQLSYSVAKNAKILAKRPHDETALKETLQYLDTIIGSARFLENKKLESVATSLINSLIQKSNL